VPESSLLSHDLFEGIFARAGLARDVEVVEEFPARYDVRSLRQHRWVRGDWQLLPWIFGRTDAGAARARPRHSAPAADRLWKMLDNLRRSLSAPPARGAGGRVDAALSGALGWTLFVRAGVGACRRCCRARGLMPRRSTVTLRSHLRALRCDLLLAVAQTACCLDAGLPGLAHVRRHRAHAVARVRQPATLLEWIPRTCSQHGAVRLRGFYGRMRAACC
jgi:cyclic beta-1,2-glucan synthetase